MTYIYTHYYLPTNKKCLMSVILVNRHQTLNIILKIKILNLDVVHVYNPGTWGIDWEYKSQLSYKASSRPA